MRFFFLLLLFVTIDARSQSSQFASLDVFDLEYVADPQIAPDGSRIVFVRAGFDIMTDGGRSALWIIDADGSNARPLTDGTASVSQPRWSPDGSRIVYVTRREKRARLVVRWMDTGQETEIASLEQGPSNLAWSPDGRHLAFSMFVAEPSPAYRADMPSPPDGADWGPGLKVIDELNYRSDGSGYTKEGFRHVFLIPSEGGTPRQLTQGPRNHAGRLAFMPDGKSIVFSSNLHAEHETDTRNSEVVRLDVESGSITSLTDRFGPDANPAVSPDGKWIAYTGFDDRFQGYQIDRLYVMQADGSGRREVSGDFDRSVGAPAWSADGSRVYFLYDHEGDTRLASMTPAGAVTDLAESVGGLSLGRPYGGGAFSVSDDGRFAFTHVTPYRPSDLAVLDGAAGAGAAGAGAKVLTSVNEDLLGQRRLGQVDEIWWTSSFDDRRIQGWIVTPPDFDPARKYPMILEIHGGPFANYGPRFAGEIQRYAAEGYVVLYSNPRGSSGYGEEFGNLIHHAYPGNDYHDLMSGVDAVLERGYVDPDQLFVTGGSGGGVLSAWIVGTTDRFRAAAVQKPVINWYSFVLNADGPGFFYRYWFPGPPWEHTEHYMARSPISRVGNVTTPTLLITGEQDFRTPISESEQFYGALKIRGVDAAMVRIPDASHGIASHPSNLIAKVQHILGWFGKYRTDNPPAPHPEQEVLPAPDAPRRW